MLERDVKVGGHYLAAVSGVKTVVRLDAFRTVPGTKPARKQFSVTNLRTGRKTAFRSAAKFQRAATPAEVAAAGAGPEAAAARSPYPAQTDLTGRVRAISSSDPKAVAVDAVEAPADAAADPTPAAGSPTSTGGEQRPDPTPGTPSGTTPSGSGPAASWPVRRAEGPSLNAVLAKHRAGDAAPVSPPAGVGTPHVEVQALAGTGKTTTAVRGLMFARGMDPGITPSPEQAAVWDRLRAEPWATARLSAFNSAITAEAGRKLEEAGLTARGVEAKGIHALGKACVLKAFPDCRRMNLDKASWVVRDRVAAAMGVNWGDLRRDRRAAATADAAAELVDLCKQTLTEPDREGLDALTSRFDVDLDGTSAARVYPLVSQVLDACKVPADGRYDFNDMLWLPYVHDLRPWQVDLQIIDESQDLNRAQQELMFKAGRRIVFVGDRNQAIYGFAGADAESMDRMGSVLGGGPRGLTRLPLTVTRRCGKAVVEEARRFVPEYRAHESNPDGKVGEARYTSEGAGEKRREVPWEKSYGPLVRPGAMVLCRCNAPLVSQCFKFLAMGVPANIQGKQIGRGITALVRKSKADTVRDLVLWVGGWLEREQDAERAKRHPSDVRLEALQDRHDCVLAFCEGEESVAGVINKVERLFTDSRDNPGVKFSTGHKAKGLEADQVFILDLPNIGPRPDRLKDWELVQERNLRYVMITRAIRELTYVR